MGQYILNSFKRDKYKFFGPVPFCCPCHGLERIFIHMIYLYRLCYQTFLLGWRCFIYCLGCQIFLKLFETLLEDPSLVNPTLAGCFFSCNYCLKDVVVYIPSTSKVDIKIVSKGLQITL
jgi:hypothetical protein